MDENELKVVCPDCGLDATVGAHVQDGACPECGRRLVAAGAAGASGGSDVADAALVAELREAFALDAEAFGSAGPCRLRREADSSVAFARALDTEELPPGSRLGDFEVLGELGRGGMGIVYRARQLSLGREVALKLLPRYARHGPTAVRRFQVEARAAARLHHTNIVSMYAQGEHNGQFYYAMELVNGVGLDRVIHHRPDLLGSTLARRAILSDQAADAGASSATPDAAPEDNRGAWTRADYRRLAGLVSEVAEALAYAHRHGVVHRDVKPRNLLLGENCRLYLTDFGLARLADEPHLTLSGEVMGTPAYLSPEQICGDPDRIDHRTDVYSLGVTLYELLTRQKPFDGETREQIITGIRTAEPIPPRRRDRRIPIELETVCLRAMEKEPARRYASAALLAQDLRRFAEGLPILSRRRGRVEKAARWVRRHKSLTVAVAATVATCVLAVGLAWSVSAARQREARQLLHRAYEQMAYFDYRRPEIVEADIDRAAALGAAPAELRPVRALALLGAGDHPAAIQQLEATLGDDPADLRALYLLAWAQWRERRHGASRETFERAESLRAAGIRLAPDGWFFRGLAIHFDEPALAIDSYRQANALRSREHGFYPQAVLHLARARNQQLYSTRSLDAFAEADASLRQLVESEQYGAYPYYLLSIAHRLAAEVYSGSQGTRDDSLVRTHYAESLEWARRGQEVEPENDRPITAEAECLESMGRFEEALEARTRAIGVAGRERTQCEGYHYRWRLRYWTGALDAALEDVAAHADCDLRSRFYAHVYPALVLAEMGRMPEALAHARALADEQPESAQAVVWSATCLRLLGRPDEARALLAERANAVDFSAELTPPQTETWVRALYGTCRDGGSFGELEDLAVQAESPWRLWGEAHFHAAAAALAEGDRETALAGFRQAYRSFDSELRYTYHAKLVYIKMQEDPAWPPWIPASADLTPGGSDEGSGAALVAPGHDGDGGT